jgi:hypothetical protein
MDGACRLSRLGRTRVESKLPGCTTTSRNPRWTSAAAEVMIHIKLCMTRGLRAASPISVMERLTLPAPGDPKPSSRLSRLLGACADGVVPVLPRAVLPHLTDHARTRAQERLP